jgi:hypothetical protein
VTRPLPGGDTRVWYRQFWPWFLIILPASVVVAGISTAFIASRHADDLVVDEYYKDGLAINRQLEKKQRATDLGISAQLQFNGETVTVQLASPVDDGAIRLLLSHPMEADRDFTVTLAQESPGMYRGALTHKIAPHWHWILEEQRDNGWRLDGIVQAGEIGNVPSD